VATKKINEKKEGQQKMAAVSIETQQVIV